jgi:hypothetical protein
VERGGTIERAAVRFASPAAVAAMVQRVVAPLGLRVDESRPWVDARLPGGERFHAVLPPLAPDGPVVTIRTFARRRLQLRDLIERGALDSATARLLEAMVAAGIAIAVSGATGTGKTTLLILAELHPRPYVRRAGSARSVNFAGSRLTTIPLAASKSGHRVLFPTGRCDAVLPQVLPGPVFSAHPRGQALNAVKQPDLRILAERPRRNAFAPGGPAFGGPALLG